MTDRKRTLTGDARRAPEIRQETGEPVDGSGELHVSHDACPSIALRMTPIAGSGSVVDPE